MKKQDLNVFNKILILGSPGAGKTHFSKQLGEVLHLPVFHLDDYYWLKGWRRIDKKLWKQILNSLCTKPAWIIEGNHFQTLEERLKYADLVIILDYSIWLCLWYFCRRSIRRYFNQPENLPKNIKEDRDYKPKISLQWRLIKLILFFKVLTRPKILRLLSTYKIRTIILPNRKFTKKWLK